MVAYVKPVERVGHRGPSAMQSREMKAGQARRLGNWRRVRRRAGLDPWPKLTGKGLHRVAPITERMSHGAGVSSSATLPQRLWQRLGCWQLFAARDRGATSSVAPEAILNHYHQL